jgi:phage terminase large subunit-like protein
VERKRLQDGDWDVVEMPGALWKFKDFEWTDRLEPRPVSEVDVRVMSVDPAVTDETGKGDETGILMGSVTNGTLTVELDLSGKMHPDDWARLIVTAYNTWGCSSIIVEDNQGKALLNIALGNAADQLGLPRPTIYTITAKDSKEARAIPVVQAYRSTPRRVYHDLALKGGALEAQLTSWVPRRNTATIQSPDRLDALVWLVRHGLWNEGKSSGYRRARTAMAQMSGKMPGA